MARFLGGEGDHTALNAMHYSYTKHQTARGARPDAEAADTVYLIKNVSELRLTYQIRLLAFMAETSGRELVIQLPKDAQVHASLEDFIRVMSRTVKIERS